jgi:epoxyqueuosine reductase
MIANHITAEFVKQKALAAGFSACGIAKTKFLEEDHKHYIQWLEEKKNGSISYLEKNVEQKTDPRKISSGFKSVIGCVISYYPLASQNSEAFYNVTKYAYARDYHLVLKEKLTALIDELKAAAPDATFEYFADSNRLLEKAWAIECGLGWRGKNSLLLNKEFGSFVFIGLILTSLELDADEKRKNLCGNCTKCVEACPVNALEKPFELYASRCITNITIEQKKDISADNRNTHGWIYGCDLCQDACPWNQKLIPASQKIFSPNQEMLKLKKEDWENLDEEKFNILFKESALKRIGFEKLKSNIKKASVS